MAKKKKASTEKNRDNGDADQEPHEVETTDIEPADQSAEENREEEERAETLEVSSLSAEEIRKLVKEKEGQHDRLLRTQADFDNYRKRVQKEQANLIRYGAETSLREILPVIDNVELAVESARTHDDSNSQLREGIELILTQFLGVLEKLGVKPIEAVGHPFDPNKHDALLRVHTQDSPEGMVLDEIRKGYYLHDKVLRPSQVTVSAEEPLEDSEQAAEESA